MKIMERFEGWLDFGDGLMPMVVSTLLLGLLMIGGVYGLCLISAISA